MTTTEIEVFLAICRHKNISKAAEALYISQATLSAHLKSLENRLGCTLLLRGKGRRTLSLTTQGQNFYQLALQYQEVLHKMNAVDRSDAHEVLQLSTIDSVGNYLLPPVLDEFLNRYPQMRLTLQVMDAESACMSIIHGKTDLALSTAKMETDQIVATLLLHDPFTVICAADTPLPETVTLKDLPLRDEIYIKWSAEYEFWHHSTFDSSPHQIQLELMGQIERFVSRPNKWALVPESVANALASSPKLRRCTPSFPIPDRSIYILRHRDNAETAGIRYFLDILREVLPEAKK